MLAGISGAWLGEEFATELTGLDRPQALSISGFIPGAKLVDTAAQAAYGQVPLEKALKGLTPWAKIPGVTGAINRIFNEEE